MGFLKYLLTFAIIAVGILLIGGAVVGAIQNGMTNLMTGHHVNSVIFWIMGIGGLVLLLYGFYRRGH